MDKFRIASHQILDVPDREFFSFSFDGREMRASAGETLSSALFANGVRVFGEKKGRPQGIFCANGQCSQCTVIADGRAVKACMTLVREGMEVFPFKNPISPASGVPVPEGFRETAEVECGALVIGAGPAGMRCAAELADAGVDVVLVDDKDRAGGKLLMQTHPFFGSKEECHAGTRGFEIASILYDEIRSRERIRFFPSSSAIGIFRDKKVGVMTPDGYMIVSPKATVVATGARERALAFPGWDLPGVYGAGAFQTLLNRDLVRPSERLFIIGAGNVGLIAAFHALQAGIKVTGICELAPSAGGYMVHALKLKRLGVPFYFGHTAVRAEGDGSSVKSITIAKMENGRPAPGTFRTIEADTVLIAVGFQSVNELYEQGRSAGCDVFACGDASEIAEASAAMFSGAITGRRVAAFLGKDVEVPEDWVRKFEMMKSRPGKVHELQREPDAKVYPALRCVQEIPCNPCSFACPNKSIRLSGESITSVPIFEGRCVACGKCVAVCPALAITVVDLRNAEKPVVMLPYELGAELIHEGDEVELTGMSGERLGKGKIERIASSKAFGKRLVVTVSASEGQCRAAAGFIVPSLETHETPPSPGDVDLPDDDVIVCRCESVTAGRIRELVRGGAESLQELKARLRCTMGPCSGRTCGQLIARICRSEGLEVEGLSLRPLEFETTFGELAGIE